MEFKWPKLGEGWAGFRWPSRGGTPTPPFDNTLSTLFAGGSQHGLASTTLNSTFEFNQPWSVSVWVKFTSMQLSVFLSNNGNGQNQGLWLSYDTAGGGRWDVQLGNTYPSSYLWVVFPHVATIGTWYHVLVTSDGTGNASGVRAIVNGASLTRSIQLNTLTTSSVPASPLYVGTYQEASYPWIGNLDELAVFNADKSSSASALYNGGTPNSLAALPGLLEWWRMGDGDSFPTLTGQQGLQNITLVNMTSGSIVTDAP